MLRSLSVPLSFTPILSMPVRTQLAHLLPKFNLTPSTFHYTGVPRKSAEDATEEPPGFVADNSSNLDGAIPGGFGNFSPTTPVALAPQPKPEPTHRLRISVMNPGDLLVRIQPVTPLSASWRS